MTAFLLALFLAVVHLFGGKLEFLNDIPRSRYLSFGGGIAVSYVFVHILPELNKHQRVIEESIPVFGFLNHHVYIGGLFGFLLFYALERHVKKSEKKGGSENFKGVFWIHITSFSFYNMLAGYLLVQPLKEEMRELLLYAVAMGIHFLVNDYGLSKEHKNPYQNMGRWLLASSILIGWAFGRFVFIPDTVVALMFALLSGGILLNVMKEELPEERDSSILAFLAGAALYTILLLFI
jgi:hypothetical protein